MAGIFKRFGNGKEQGENEPGTKLYGSLRALRSPLRSNTPTKRRSRSLELPNEVPDRQSGHSRFPSAQESSFRRPLSPQTHSSPTSRLRSGIADSRAVSPTPENTGGIQTGPKKKKRGNLLSRALSSLRNSAVYPGQSAMPNNIPSKSGSHSTFPNFVPPPSIPMSQSATSKIPLDISQAGQHVRSSASNYPIGDPGRHIPHSESDRSTPASEGQTSASMSASGSNPSRHHLPLSTSEPGPWSSRTMPASGHVPNSTSDPGPSRSDAASPPPDAQAQRESRDEAYQRLVKAERRKSPLSRMIPPLFRRNSADVKSDSLIGRVGAPMKRVSTREDSRAVSRNASVEFHDPSTSRTKVTSVGSVTQLTRPRASRHHSFDFESQQSKTTPMVPAAPEGKVRFVEPVIEEGSHDGDSGVSGLRSDAEVGAGRDKQTEIPSSSSRTDVARRSSSRHPPVSIDSSRHARRAKLRDTSPDMAANPRDTGSASAPVPLGTAYTSHGLPLFSFEPISASPSPSTTSFAAHPSARPAFQPPPIDSRERRRDKGRSLDLAIGLTWAPKKVREDALLSFGRGGQSSKSKWGADARMSEVLLTSDLQELGVPPKQRVMNAFRQVLDEPGYLTFKRYCRRYEVGALPLRGPTGILGHLERLLDTAAEISSREKQDLLDQFAQFAAGR